MIGLAVLGFVGSVPAFAQTTEKRDTVSAHSPRNVFVTLKNGGYDAKFVPQKDDTPEIELTLSSGLVTLLFTDCDEETNRKCDTIILSATWDRKTPAPDSMIVEANSAHRYVSVWRDNEGDPVMQWWILTGKEGVPRKLFLKSIGIFEEVAKDFQEVVFEEVAEDLPEFEL